jgi:hypothetical protein
MSRKRWNPETLELRIPPATLPISRHHVHAHFMEVHCRGRRARWPRGLVRLPERFGYGRDAGQVLGGFWYVVCPGCLEPPSFSIEGRGTPERHIIIRLDARRFSLCGEGLFEAKAWIGYCDECRWVYWLDDRPPV